MNSLFFLHCWEDVRKSGGCSTTQNGGISFWLLKHGAFLTSFCVPIAAIPWGPVQIFQEKGPFLLWWGGVGSQTQNCVHVCESHGGPHAP